jgi:hypothetical protein
MRIEISDEVWNEIAKNGKFGETEDAVLRRLLRIPSHGTESSPSPRFPSGIPATRERRSLSHQRFATTKMSTYVQKGTLIVEFATGSRKSFVLPGKENKPGIRKSRDEAIEFARQNRASYGQEMAVKKALTEAGYHLTK